MINAFNLASTPNVVFGNGKVSSLPAMISKYGTKALIVTGSGSFQKSVPGASFYTSLENAQIDIAEVRVSCEPTPSVIDDAVSSFSEFRADVVVAIGGGSALDAGKAISAMLPLREPVKLFLEGVGTKIHPGTKIPFIAVPTTSGTGSEATKNSVISEVGPAGYKKSLRHNNFVPDVAVIDPALTLSCPQSQTAASGMDAFTQLLESYLSTNSNPVTDALALEGLSLISRSLLIAYKDGSNISARSDLSLAAYLSGVTLANAGLGLVHGFASSVGGYFDIPHGIICSSTMATANKLTVQKLRRGPDIVGALEKYYKAGTLFSSLKNRSHEYYVDHLLEVIEYYRHELNIPRLGSFGVEDVYVSKIVSVTDNKFNPVSLSKEEIEEVLRSSL